MKLSDVTFSLRALQPPKTNFDLPLPGTRAFEKVNGRAGDLVIVQLKSMTHARATMQDAARTLGLRGVASASLRNSRDATTWGNIRVIRDYVTVIHLGGVQYKEIGKGAGHKGGDLTFERPQYGTNSRPAQLVRSETGDYFAYESDSTDVLLMWSSDDDLAQAVKKAELVYSDSINDNSQCAISFDEGGVTRSVEPTLGASRDIVAQHLGDVALFQLCANDVEITWRRPYQRFHDRETYRAEMSLYMPNDGSMHQVRRLIDATGSSAFFRDAHCFVQVRRRGSLISIPV